MLPTWITRLWRRSPKPPTEPPDPATVPNDQWSAVVNARVDAGLKPWPNKADSDYLNTVIGTCSLCNRSIYGGQAISFDWDEKGQSMNRCGQHFRSVLFR